MQVRLDIVIFFLGGGGLERWEKRILVIGHFRKYHNSLCLSPQILHKHCFLFVLGLTVVPVRLMQNLEWQTKSIMVLSQVAYMNTSKDGKMCRQFSALDHIHMYFALYK